MGNKMSKLFSNDEPELILSEEEKARLYAQLQPVVHIPPVALLGVVNMADIQEALAYDNYNLLHTKPAKTFTNTDLSPFNAAILDQVPEESWIRILHLSNAKTLLTLEMTCIYFANLINQLQFRERLHHEEMHAKIVHDSSKPLVTLRSNPSSLFTSISPLADEITANLATQRFPDHSKLISMIVDPEPTAYNDSPEGMGFVMR